MNDQGMQFADPEWRPPQRRDLKFDKLESEMVVPKPIDRDVPPSSIPGEAEEAAASNEDGYFAEPYAGLAPQQLRPDRPLAQPSGQYWPPIRQQRRSSRLAWVIISIVLFMFAFSWAIGSTVVRFGDRPDFKSMGPMPMGPPAIYTLASNPTIIINDSIGNVNVNTASNSGNQVLLQTGGRGIGRDFGRDEAAKPSVSTDKATNTITINDTNADMTVTVPENANLQIQDNVGDIEVNGVVGKLNLLQTGQGNIHVGNSTLTGDSSFTAHFGEIRFNGSLTSHATYAFSTNDGAVSLDLPANSSFHLHAKTNLGSFSSTFAGLPSGDRQGPGAEVQGNVGSSASDTSVNLTNNTGSINIDQH